MTFIYQCGEIWFVRHDVAWVAHLPSPHGRLELLCGEGDEPDFESIFLVERLSAGEDRIAAVRKSVFLLPWLWQPIRLAVNDEGRLGLQFRHRLTGRQKGMFLADEHSTFAMNRFTMTLDEKERSRLRDIRDSWEQLRPR